MGSRSPPKKTASSSGRPLTVKFARRTSSGRVTSLSRDEKIELGLSGEFGSNSDRYNDYVNYTVLMPPTPDNQPSKMKPDDHVPPPPYGKRGAAPPARGGGEMGQGPSKMGQSMSVMKNNNKYILLRSQTQDFDHNRWLFETKGTYGIGNAFWTPEGVEEFGEDDGGIMHMADFMDKPWKPLTRKINIPLGHHQPLQVMVKVPDGDPQYGGPSACQDGVRLRVEREAKGVRPQQEGGRHERPGAGLRRKL